MFCLLILARPAFAADATRWFRGQLHTHTYLSDGRGFAEQAIAAYQQRGYDFLAISDHNRFADNRNVWREVAIEEGPWPPKPTQTIFADYLRKFGDDWVEQKKVGAAVSVRLKTYAELKARFEKPGKFLLLPGVEFTQTLAGRGVHLNYINLPVALPCIKNADLVKNVQDVANTSALIAQNAAEAAQAAATAHRPYLLMLNHRMALELL